MGATAKCSPQTVTTIELGSTFRSCPHRSKQASRSEEHTSELQSWLHLVCRLLLEKKKNQSSTLENMDLHKYQLPHLYRMLLTYHHRPNHNRLSCPYLSTSFSPLSILIQSPHFSRY